MDSADRSKAKDKIAEAFRLGSNQSVAAGYAGVSLSTLRRWKAADPDFAARCREAEEAAIEEWAARVLSESDKWLGVYRDAVFITPIVNDPSEMERIRKTYGTR